ncbi:hypothetical protein DV737_g907, partial [Chaetothyriales sp. CBS 132003]
MAATSLPPVASLVTLTPDARAAVLDLLLEPSPALHTVAASPILATTTYPTYSALIAAVSTHLVDLLNSDLESEQKQLDEILSSHPRLGAKKGPEALSEMSRREQEAMRAAEGKGGAAPEQGQGSVEERLGALNDQYEAKFAGLKYVTFVNGRPRPVIMADMERRINRGDLNQEKLDAIKVTHQFHILLGCRDLSAGETAISRLCDAHDTSQPITAVELDIASHTSIKAAVDSVQTNFGRLNVLVNNAGYAAKPKQR